MARWLLTIKDRHRMNRQRSVTYDNGRPSDYQVATEKGNACFMWYCFPHELDTTLQEMKDND